MESFVEKQRFSGASYKAANWIYLGQTSGKDRSGMNYYCHGIIKDVYLYPLINISILRETFKKDREEKWQTDIPLGNWILFFLHDPT